VLQGVLNTSTDVAFLLAKLDKRFERKVESLATLKTDVEDIIGEKEVNHLQPSTDNNDNRHGAAERFEIVKLLPTLLVGGAEVNFTSSLTYLEAS
jgi:hypothetical protein